MKLKNPKAKGTRIEKKAIEELKKAHGCFWLFGVPEVKEFLIWSASGEVFAIWYRLKREISRSHHRRKLKELNQCRSQNMLGVGCGSGTVKIGNLRSFGCEMSIQECITFLYIKLPTNKF